MTEHITLRVRRQDRPDAAPRIETFRIPYRPSMNVISCLMEIRRRPATAEGNATTPVEAAAGVAALADSPEQRADLGRRVRDWLVRTHGKEQGGRRLLAILRMTADRVPVPGGLDNPLLDVDSDAERRYHNSCVTVRAD